MTSDVAFCLSLIGKPWVPGARGPEAFDCWGLLVFVYHHLLGVELPSHVCDDVRNRLKVARAVLAEGDKWERLDRPRRLCAVGISANRVVHHVGVWLGTDGGGVLHAAEQGGVVFQSVPSLRQGNMQNLTFYQLKP